MLSCHLLLRLPAEMWAVCDTKVDTEDSEAESQRRLSQFKRPVEKGVIPPAITNVPISYITAPKSLWRAEDSARIMGQTVWLQPNAVPEEAHHLTWGLA